MRIYRYRRNPQPREHFVNPAGVAGLEGASTNEPAYPDAKLAVSVGEAQPVVLESALSTASVPPHYRGDVTRSLAAFIEAGADFWRLVEDAVAAARDRPDAVVDLDDPDVQLHSPLDRCSSLRDFFAFEDHVQNGARRRGGDVPAYWYEAPVYYKGNHRAWIDPDAECPWPPYTHYLDFELELAMIVGKPGRDVPKEAAGDHIFGFSILNDFSARDVQMKEVTAWLGPAKGKDFANALGPCVVTADEIGTEPDLEMTCRVNGEEWGRGKAGSKHWSWAEMIAYVSTSEDIHPTDVYGSGTPGGCCGLDLERRLEPGDVVELEIEKIGVLRNVVGPRP